MCVYKHGAAHIPGAWSLLELKILCGGTQHLWIPSTELASCHFSGTQIFLDDSWVFVKYTYPCLNILY
jgi:hypothetical protein